MNKIRMNRTWEEFSKLPKVKQIFTPWFITALVVFIVFGAVAFTMVGLLNHGFTTARSLIENGDIIYGTIANPKIGGSEHSLMSYLGYDPHANYQVMFKEISAYLTANPNKSIADLQAMSKEQLNNNALYEALHYHAHTPVINHNSTWGFVVKVLSGGTEGWFYKYTELFAHGSATHASSTHALATPQQALALINKYQDFEFGYNYNAFYWVFIICMMPQMIATVIIVTKLATVLNPKKSKEEKAAYKLEKQKAKLLKKDKTKKEVVYSSGSDLQEAALGAN